MAEKELKKEETASLDEEIARFMQEATAHLRYIRISPRKVGIVLDLIRGKSVGEALAILKYTPKSASEHLIKLLKSASANALNNYQMDVAKLFVAECFVCPGPILKRIRPMSKGRAYRIEKRSSHITIKLRERY